MPPVCLTGPSSPSVPTGSSPVPCTLCHCLALHTWFRGMGQRHGSCEGLSAVEVRPLCAPLGWSLQSRHAQDTHLAPVRPVTAAPALSCSEPSTLEAQHASCFVFSSQCGDAILKGAALGKGSSGLLGMQPACLGPASSTLDPVSLDRQFRIYTSGRLGG